MSGKHFGKTSSESSKGTDPAANTSILNNVANHETGILGKSI
jgi:hypothetical protein